MTTSPAALSRRQTLHSSAFALVEDFAAPPDKAAPVGHSPQYQIVFPYFGAFLWKVGSKAALLDSNRILFVGAGEDFRESHAGAREGHASVIITPHPQMLDEVCGRRGPKRTAAFGGISTPMAVRAQLLSHQLLSCRPSAHDSLRADELTIALLREAFTDARERAVAAPSRVVERAKQVLHARGAERLSLEVVARELGVSGAYLTDAFRRAEGVPLYRYQTRLRLGKALVALPRCENIAALAIELGFSSHSHFTNAFRSVFGVAPSAFRTSHIAAPPPTPAPKGSASGRPRGSSD